MIEYLHQRDYETPICPIPYGGPPTDYTLIAMKNGSYAGHIAWLSETTGGIVSVFVAEDTELPENFAQMLIDAAVQYASNHPGMQPPTDLPPEGVEAVIHPPGGLNVG